MASQIKLESASDGAREKAQRKKQAQEAGGLRLELEERSYPART